MKDTITKLNDIKAKALAEVDKASSLDALNELKTKILGRKSELNDILKSIKDINKEERSLIGRESNITKETILKAIETKTSKLTTQKLKSILKDEWMDVTIPGIKPQEGSIHPLTQMRWKVEDIFQKMGFEIYSPYEIDDDYHNFESVNIPKGHPARDAWDTFWTEDENILITHTSSMQNRVMKSSSLPIRAIVPGKCFRNEATDARHEHTFYQVEGVYIDKGITIKDMLGTLKTFFEAFFEKEIQVKFMPDFFPFVEPGGQMALSCVLCDMKGCKVCKGTGWLEVLGCGMIHPNVLKEANIDPEIYTGFAWGFGLERLIMLKHNIEDIRIFHSGDLRFITQF